MIRIFLVFAVVTGYAIAPAAAASATPQPFELTQARDGPVLLTVETAKGARTFTLRALEALGTYRVRTSTFWPADNGVYDGVLMSDLLRAAGLGDAPAVRVIALDGYSQVLPRGDWTRWPLMIATRRNGRPLTRRHKGPLRVVYPRDSDKRLADQAFRLRWVWMVKTIRRAKQ